MKIRDLNNEIHTWSLSGYVVAANEMRPRSKLHLAARELLIQLFPTVQVMEEVLVPLTRYEKGYFDFYINTLKLVVEVHGQQHYKFNSLFHIIILHTLSYLIMRIKISGSCEYSKGTTRAN